MKGGYKMRKKFLLLTVIAMLVPQVSFANEKTQGLEGLLGKVKAKIEVPKAFTEFNYNQSGEDYRFIWQDQEGKQGSLYVECESDGDILSYRLNLYHTSDSTLAKIDWETGKAKAESFLNQVVPEYAKALVLRERTAPSSDYDYTYVYDLYHEGVKVFNQVIYVNVNKQTGEIKSFSGIDFSERTYNANQPKITLEQAEVGYLKQVGLPALYKTYYDWKTEEKSSFLVYKLQNGERKGIDAATGALVVHYKNEDNELYKEATTEESQSVTAKNDSGASGLTPSERKAVEETKGLLSVEVILDKVAKHFPRVKSATVSRNNLYKQKEIYIRQIVLKDEVNKTNVSLTVDAKTAEIENYYFWSSTSPETAEYHWSEKEAASFLSQVAPQQFKETKLIEDEYTNEDMTTTNYYYGRLVNHLLVDGEGLSITYDQRLGEVTSYSKNWSQMSFKSPEGMMSKENAVKNIGLELVYMETSEDVYRLAYTTRETYMLLDAFNGKEVDYSGKVMEEEAQKFYTDLKGHPKEALIKKLFDSGIYLKGEKLKPDLPISEEDFLNLLCQVTQGYKPDENENVSGWYKEVTGKATLDKQQTLTREKSVYDMISATPYKKIASISELYVYPFEDKQYDEALKGHISVAYGLKLIQKDKTGLFRPKDKLTRAEALEMMYYLLLSTETE
ncbi:hypothetical protein EKH84_09520 [Cellulosilyticum sp. WCF-2]|nr:hypothetical protein EKH84_09520 [Cellulosilyticum sp. WCF-2]